MKSKVENQGARDTVYSFLHKKIMDMQLMPGAVINLKDLAEYLEVSRSPIRDALMQLEKEYLVETTPKKGTYVSKIDVQRVKDERFMRACIEEKIAEIFMNVYTQKDYQELESNLHLQNEAFKNRDTRTFLQLDDDFHSVMYKATDYTYCLQNIKNFSGHYHRIRLLSLSDPDICSETIKQHVELMALINSHQVDELQKQITAHIYEKGTEVKKLQKRYPTLFLTASNEDKATQNIWENDFLSEL